ncbi:DUF2336 domain-containing protein [Glycocaulis sp.]|uniref:DUF2336 domain-containing protein n=1 Tax=Glycocaulis sp. TaxID=1969725 RepID=UPI003D226035
MDRADPATAPSVTARSRLTRRLADIVCLPSSQVSPQERWVVADVLEEIMRHAAPDLRVRIARRLAEQAEAPPGLLRRLALDTYEVAEPILQSARALTDFDLMEIAAKGEGRHRLAIARREHVSEVVSAALVSAGGTSEIQALLANPGARLASQTVDRLAQMAGSELALAHLLIKRAELRPAQAMTLFWECGHAERRALLERFAVGRTILQDAAEDVFPLAASETPRDELIGRALNYIERRQRNRAAADQSPYGSLEGAIEEAARTGLTPELIDEMARLANVQRSLLDRMLGDFGGEPLAVLTKATGLSRGHLMALLQAAGRGDPAPEQARYVFDTLSVDKAQTVLRYWNWSLTRPAA